MSNLDTISFVLALSQRQKKQVAQERSPVPMVIELVEALGILVRIPGVVPAFLGSILVGLVVLIAEVAKNTKGVS